MPRQRTDTALTDLLPPGASDLHRTVIARIQARLEDLDSSRTAASLQMSHDKMLVDMAESKRGPTINRIADAAKALRCNVPYLLGLSDDPNNDISPVPERPTPATSHGRIHRLVHQLDLIDLASIRALREYLLLQSEDARKTLERYQAHADRIRADLLEIEG